VKGADKRYTEVVLKYQPSLGYLAAKAFNDILGGSYEQKFRRIAREIGLRDNTKPRVPEYIGTADTLALIEYLTGKHWKEVVDPYAVLEKLKEG